MPYHYMPCRQPPLKCCFRVVRPQDKQLAAVLLYLSVSNSTIWGWLLSSCPIRRQTVDNSRVVPNSKYCISWFSNSILYLGNNTDQPIMVWVGKGMGIWHMARGSQWTPINITRARHALLFYTLRANTPETALRPFCFDPHSRLPPIYFWYCLNDNLVSILDHRNLDVCTLFQTVTQKVSKMGFILNSIS
jgi:hypothetical protein